MATVAPEDYLRAERKAEFRSEYIDGAVYAMSGGSFPHAQLISRMAYLVNRSILDGPCQVVTSELRVRVGKGTAYVYPDVVVVCDKPQFADAELDTVLNPSVVVEVLSDSTEQLDRGRKFFRYQSIPTLKEYVLISQHDVLVECYTRQANAPWLYTQSSGDAASIRLDSLALDISLAELYRNILPA